MATHAFSISIALWETFQIYSTLSSLNRKTRLGLAWLHLPHRRQNHYNLHIGSLALLRWITYDLFHISKFLRPKDFQFFMTVLVTLTCCWISFGRQIEHKLWPHFRIKTFPSKISMQTGHFKWSGFILDFSWRLFFLKFFSELELLNEVGFWWMSRMNRILKI